MTNTKKIVSVFLALLMLLPLALPAFAEGDETASQTEKTQTQSSEFCYDDAEKIALTAAKSKMILEGLPNDITGQTVVTKVSYNKDTGRYKATVRAEYKYKYTCYIATNEILGKTIGFLVDSEFDEQNVVIGFFGQLFDKIAYFFIKKFS
ncbi:MAG: hypothetical protein ACI4GA_05285 [Acutalibacteraceae bacterium]|nr:hypothetical protein [Oscillospiraceae bacterium]